MVLTNLSGRVVLSQPVRGATSVTVDLPASVHPGVYLLQVQDAGCSSSPKRLVVQ